MFLLVLGKNFDLRESSHSIKESFIIADFYRSALQINEHDNYSLYLHRIINHSLLLISIDVCSKSMNMITIHEHGSIFGCIIGNFALYSICNMLVSTGT